MVSSDVLDYDEHSATFKARYYLEFDEDAKYVLYPTSRSVKFDLKTPLWASDNASTQDSYVTVLDYGGGNGSTTEWLESCLTHRSFANGDDVWRRQFLETILVKGLQIKDIEMSAELESFLTKHGTRRLMLQEEPQDLPCGPYRWYQGHLWQVHRLHRDENMAFLMSVRQTEAKSFQIVSEPDNNRYGDAIAVPSRMARTKSPAEPLSGWRIALEDTFDLEGVQTSMCTKAALELYLPASHSADAIATVVEKGATILGKTKLSMLLSEEEPIEAVGYETPCNPRGDRHQRSGGSSSGSTVAVAAYDWIDIGIGIDTNGSIRGPAQRNGVFGLRPSHGALPNKHMFTIFRYFDVPGIFARDFQKLVDFAAVWYADNMEKPEQGNRPYSVVLITDYLSRDTELQTQQVTKFAEDLAMFLEVTVRQVTMTSLWEETKPADAYGESLHDWLEEVGASIFLYSYYHATATFRNYKKHSEEPAVSPFVAWRWSIGKKRSLADHLDGMRRMRVYESWILEEVLQRKQSRTLVITQSEAVRPSYRNAAPPAYQVQPAWHQWWMSPVCGAPGVVLPVDQIPYESQVTGQEEHLPVAVDVMGEPNSDKDFLVLMNDFLKATGRHRVVNAGRQMFPVS